MSTSTAIYTLSIECMTGPHWKDRYLRVIETPGDTTLGDLHFIMLELTGFDDSDHLTGFYQSNAWYGRRKEWLTVSDDGDEGEEELLWDKPLTDLFPLPRNRKLYYLFDFGDSWIFEIRTMGRQKKPTPGVEYPLLIQEEGSELVQYEYPDEDFM